MWFGMVRHTALSVQCFPIQRMPPLIGRFVPFVAVAVANAINIPLMRQRELRYGIPVVDEEDKRLGMSKVDRQNVHIRTHKLLNSVRPLESKIPALRNTCYRGLEELLFHSM